MPFEDYLSFFENYSTCYYEDSFTLSSFHDELDNEFIGCYKAEVGKDGDYYVLFSQEDRNGFFNREFPNCNDSKIPAFFVFLTFFE